MENNMELEDMLICLGLDPKECAGPWKTEDEDDVEQKISEFFNQDVFETVVHF